MIGWFTLTKTIPKDRAEAMLLHLVSADGKAAFRDRRLDGVPLYSNLHLTALRTAEKYQADPHSITDEDFDDLRGVGREEARRACANEPFRSWSAQSPDEYIKAFENGFLVEIMWNIAHFSGLLNGWFTVLRVPDEDEFVKAYNQNVPAPLIERNNALLGTTGWGK